MITCPKCGKQTHDKAKECPYCKSPLSNSTVIHKNNSSWIMITLAVIASAAIIGAKLFFDNNKNVQKSENGNSSSSSVQSVIAENNQNNNSSSYSSVDKSEGSEPIYVSKQENSTQESSIQESSIQESSILEVINKYKYTLKLDLKLETNLVFAKYDVWVYLDDKRVMVLDDHESTTRHTVVLNVGEGSHTINYKGYKKKSGDLVAIAEEEVNVTSDTVYSRDLHRNGSDIEIKVA